MDIFSHFHHINIFYFETADGAVPKKVTSQFLNLCEDDRKGAFALFQSIDRNQLQIADDIASIPNRLAFLPIPKGEVVVHESGTAFASGIVVPGNKDFEDIAKAAVQISKKLKAPFVFEEIKVVLVDDEDTLKAMRKTLNDEKYAGEYFLASKHTVDEIIGTLKFKLNKAWDKSLLMLVKNAARTTGVPERTAQFYPELTKAAQKNLG